MRAVNITGRKVTSVAVDIVDTQAPSACDGRPLPSSSGAWPARSGFEVRSGQLVATQVALALLLAAIGADPLLGTAAVLTATAIGLGAWCRVRRRWLFEWLAVGLRHLVRRHELETDAGAAALLGFVAPTARVLPGALTDGIAAIEDDHGLTALLELDEPADLLSEAVRSSPSPAALLAAAGRRLPARVQVVLSAVSAPVPGADGAAATSYRQLTRGQVPAHLRVVLAIRMLRSVDRSPDGLVRALSSAVRRVRRALAPLPVRPLDENAALRALAELAWYDPAHPVRERWSTIHLGGLVQATFRLGRWPGGHAELVPKLLTLPATAVTVALAAGPGPTASTTTDLTVRLAAADPVALASAADALHELLAGNGSVRRLDGDHLTGLAETLPLGLAPSASAPAGPPDPSDLPLVPAGLVVGVNRHGAPVTVRLFGPEPRRAVLVGGLPAAQLVVLRAMALNARVVVRTVRPRAWESFARTVPRGVVSIAPWNATTDTGASLRPLLIVVDAGPVAPDRLPTTAWQATLVVRDELTPADTGLLSQADLVLLQPLRRDEAALAGDALGLGESARWLGQIGQDMVAVVNRQALRWALLAVTPTERYLVGPPVRP